MSEYFLLKLKLLKNNIPNKFVWKSDSSFFNSARYSPEISETPENEKPIIKT